MEVTERERREGIASELADIFYRQQAIVRSNEYLNLSASANTVESFRTMAEEDHKTLRMVESVISSFGIRVAPKKAAMAMADLLTEIIEDDSVTPLEQLGIYTLVKQNQMLCCHLVHKSAQVSKADIKLTISPFEGVYATFTKHVSQLTAFTEKFGVEWITGDLPASGLMGRARDAFATAVGAVLSKAAKPMEEMNVMTVLTMDHRKVDALFLEIKSTSDFQAAKDLFDQLKADLTAHSIAEENTVYSRFIAFADAREKFTEARQEHAELRSLLDDVSYVAEEEEIFYEKIDELHDLVKHHVAEEESELFALIKTHSKEIEQIEICRAFLAEKRSIQENIGTDPVIASVGDLNSDVAREQGM